MQLYRDLTVYHFVSDWLKDVPAPELAIVFTLMSMGVEATLMTTTGEVIRYTPGGKGSRIVKAIDRCHAIAIEIDGRLLDVWGNEGSQSIIDAYEIAMGQGDETKMVDLEDWSTVSTGNPQDYRPRISHLDPPRDAMLRCIKDGVEHLVDCAAQRLQRATAGVSRAENIHRPPRL